MAEIKFDKPDESKGFMTMEGGLAHKTERSQLHRHLYIMSFADVEDFWRCGDDSESLSTTDTSREYRSSRKTSEQEWSGTPSWEAALNLGINGWTEGVESMRKILKDVRTAGAMMPSGQDVKHFSVAGSRVSVPRYLAGNPKCMKRKRHVRTSDGNHIKVSANIVYNAGTSVQTIMRRGAAICALISRLEADGYNTELIAYEGLGSHSDSTMRLIVHVPVKRPEDFLNEERVSMMFAHPSTLRRGIFAVEERLPKGIFNKYLQGGYGACKDINDTEAAIMGYDLNIPGLESDKDIDWKRASDKQLAEWVSKKWTEAVERVAQ